MIATYADDTTVLAKHEDPKDASVLLQKYLNNKYIIYFCICGALPGSNTEM